MGSKVPCYNCQKRSVGCHGKCQEYLKWHDGVVERKNHIRDEKMKTAQYDRFRAEGVRREYRRKGK